MTYWLLKQQQKKQQIIVISIFPKLPLGIAISPDK